MKTIKVKPRDGLIVRREENGKTISANGEDVPNTTYYRRRMKDGDLVNLDAAKTKAAVKKSTAKEGAE